MTSSNGLVLRNREEAIWVSFTYRGRNFKLKLRPSSSQKGSEIRERHTSVELIPNPENGKLPYKQRTLDHSKYLDDLADYLIEDFQGIDSPDNKPLPPTKENKISVAFLIPGPDDKDTLWDQILMKSAELQTVNEAEDAEKKKD